MAAPGAEPVAIRIPVPFPIGDVNAYLLCGEPITLVDPGPRSPAALAALEHGLASHGLRVEDVELVVLTHHHVDHAGLAATVQRRSGCRVAGLAAVAELMGDEPAARSADDAYTRALMALHGAPPEAIAQVPVALRAGAGWTESVTVDTTVRDGDALVAGGRELVVRHRPGHSPADTVLIGEDGSALLGDHLLARTPVAVIDHRPPFGPDDPRARPSAALAYRDSLRATAADELRCGWPGHGRPVTDPAAVIAARLAAQEERAAALLPELDDRGTTAWELVAAAWARRPPRLEAAHPIASAFIATCGVLADLDLLVEAGRARVEDDGTIMRHQPVR